MLGPPHHFSDIVWKCQFHSLVTYVVVTYVVVMGFSLLRDTGALVRVIVYSCIMRYLYDYISLADVCFWYFDTLWLYY